MANPDWQTWVRDMQSTALKIRAAAKAKDTAKFSAAADHLSEMCQSCHTGIDHKPRRMVLPAIPSIRRENWRNSGVLGVWLKRRKARKHNGE